MNPILPPKGKPALKSSTIYLPPKLWETLEEIVEITKQEDPGGKGYNRNEVVIHFIEWASREFMAQHAEAKKRKK